MIINHMKEVINVEPEQDQRIPLYVLNNFLKFDRKLYQFFGVKLGRPIPFKGVLYFLVFGVMEVIWYVTPVLGKLIHWIPTGVLIALPIILAWLITDVGTENRSPVAFFRSLFLYHMRRWQGVTFNRGKAIPRERHHVFRGYYTHGIKRNEFKPRSYRYKGFVTYK
ncbi:TcpE family conjugal transfer membrane protein [Lentibacillus amyloliquefaciens]|uniref:TcpE family conjugal transfer membrane protein n=1 Tax=Lentibacillus amyloliquefaciens TaxID=1472767 RepID=UPI001470018C|nr:TcpE family conjugal transfer membrane protein [Lentibacillus amyloliquefaciens]